MPENVVSLMALGLTAAVAIGGWVWHLAGQATRIGAVERRVTTLEASDSNRDEKIGSMAERLARIESMMEYMVSRLRGDMSK